MASAEEMPLDVEAGVDILVFYGSEVVHTAVGTVAPGWAVSADAYDGNRSGTVDTSRR